MNILHLRASNFYGGPERQLHVHASLARGSRYDVTVGSFTEAGRSPEFIDVISQDGLRTYVFPVESAYDHHAIGLVHQWLKTQQIDVLCTHDYRSHFIGYLAKRGLPVKWVAFSRGFTWDNWKVRTYHWIEKLIIRFAHHVVAVSEAQRAKLVRLHVPAAKVSVVHNAIDTHVLEEVVPVDLKARFGFPPNAIVVVSAGRFSREKGQTLLAQAGALAVKKNPCVRIVMFGNGPDLELVKQTVRELHCEQYILCPGFERNALGCIKGADIVVNSSLSEGLPNIVLEGMALGVPVIATAVGGVPELIADGCSGLLVPPQDAYALTDALLRLAGDAGLRRRLAEGAYAVVRESFSFEGQMSKLAHIYDEVGGR